MSNQSQVAADLIQQLEDARGSKVITYFTSDRQGLGNIMIGPDIIRPLYDHLLALDRKDANKIDFLIYSRGGDVSVPWRMVAMFREFCDKFAVLIPYKAYSAATMVSLGADEIVMGRKAELSPIDPTLQSQDKHVSVEDINSFLLFIKERANINDQSALAQIISVLTDKIGPDLLGQVNRLNSHIPLVARKLLTSRGDKLEEDKINAIIETLTEKMYAHSHGIGRQEAKELGLPVVSADESLDKLMWQIYMSYEDFLQLNNPFVCETELEDKETVCISDYPIEIMESAKKSHTFKANFELKRQRKVPDDPKININLNLVLQLPPDTDASTLPQQLQQQLQQMVQQAQQQLQQQLQEQTQQQMVRQSPIIGHICRRYGGRWHEMR